ncbi:hypothetical protein AB9R83_15235 (plasmid) [Oceanimonas smirnovii]|uniref:hypothetical protein n=1 Tax=Oceanimonas smirnovii TaxID=264574 RepID=UPI003AAC963F
MAAPKRDKTTRAIRLDVEVDDRLQVVCKRLGVTINAFLISAVGEAIVRHESQMRIENGAIDLMREMMSTMLSAVDQDEMQKRMDEALKDEQEKSH